MSFYIKYIQPSGAESLSGPWDTVNKFADTGLPEVHAFSDSGNIQFGPIHCRASDEINPTVYVMNERGSTVATYRL